MKEMNLIKDFLSDENLSKIVKEYGLKYYKDSFVIEQEWDLDLPNEKYSKISKLFKINDYTE
jgi:hypothetical protein